MQNRYLRASLFTFLMICLSAAAFAQVRITVGFAPPPLPVYEQPLCPGDGYIWTPGYWAWGGDFDDYYWVPGTWVTAPEVGYLWTPAYWGWDGGAFVFYDGYWGPTVGFYGGINYGFGYFGNGFEGGRWDGGHFFYNRAVTNVNVTVIHNVYNTTVVNRTENRVSYNGGNGGLTARATAQEEAAARERHISAVAAQNQNMQEARTNPEQRAARNNAKPPVAATARPGEFNGGNVVKASEAGGRYEPPANRGNNAGRPGNPPTASTPSHIRELPPAERPSVPNTGNAKADMKTEQQLNKQYAKQQQERQKLQAQQEKEDQKLAKQNNAAKQQQVEQRHQQQTQQLQQRHQQQTEQMQQRVAPRQEAPRQEARPH
jgi:hypothetical protein